MHNTYTLTNGTDAVQVHAVADGILAMMGSDAFWGGIDEVLVLIHADDPEAERGSVAILIYSDAPANPMDEITFGLGVHRGAHVGVTSTVATAPLTHAVEVALHALNDIDELLAGIDNDNDNDNEESADVVYH